jgi:hypothetical protein
MTARITAIGTVLGLLFAGIATPALAGDPESRQAFDFEFTSKRPGHSTGFTEVIDYRNPADPDAKPPAVQQIVLELAPGSKIDTSAPAICAASDPIMILQGPAACPPGSRLGNGKLQLDTGTLGPARFVRAAFEALNADRELIFLFQEELSGARVVSRSAVTRRTFTTIAPPIPGGPPDLFAAIDTVRLEVAPVTSIRDGERRRYVRTPRTCPPSGRWINTATFTYRDGVSETVTSASRCRARR